MNIIDTSEGKVMKQKRTQTGRKTRSASRLNKIRQVLQRHLPELGEHYGVHALWIFGSYARGEPYNKSDLDILVEFDRTPSLFEFVRLERYLSKILKTKVDLVMKRALKPAIGRHIVKEAQPIGNPPGNIVTTCEICLKPRIKQPSLPKMWILKHSVKMKKKFLL